MAEDNLVWPSLIDLYQALVLYDEGDDAEARRRCIAAQKFFRRFNLAGKLVLSQLLLAQLYLRSGRSRLALSQCKAALNRLATLELPPLSCQAQSLTAQIYERAENHAQSYSWYQAARQTLETLRTSLPGEELKTSFMKDKSEVYEGLVDLCLKRGSANQQGRGSSIHRTVQITKSAGPDFKSRSEFDLTPNVHSEPYRKVHELRAEINWYSHTLEIEQLRTNKSYP